MFSISQDLTQEEISGMSSYFYCASTNRQHKIFFLIKAFFLMAFIRINVRCSPSASHEAH